MHTKMASLKQNIKQHENTIANLETEKATTAKARKEQIEERDKRIKDLEDKLNEIRADKSSTDSKVFYGRGWILN